MDADRVWNELQITGKNVIVGVVDTGICMSGGLTHRDLRNQLWVNTDEIPGNNVDDDNNGYVDDINGCSWENNTKGVNVTDNAGHGTHVSGTVAGDGTEGTQSGMAPDALVQVLKFWNSFSGQLSVWNCMQYGVDNGADVLTASLGWPLSQNPDRPTWRRNCENAIAAGVVVVYAAGNEGDAGNPCPGGTNYRIRTPGDVPMVITVGATTCSDTIASFSSRGNVTWIGVQGYNDHPCPPGYLKPTIAAPGDNTKSTRICTGYTNMSGTSMATPHVAGCIALMLSANPGLTHAQVKQILKDTAKDLGDPGPDRHFGAGRVNCFEAVKKAIELSGKKGDLNCDDVINFVDIEPFVLALSDPDAYRRLYPDCNIMNADCNNDGRIDFADINPFVDLLGS
jgi:subtilisin family serine protease